MRKRLEQLLHIIEDMTRICPLEGNGDQLEGFQIAALSERTGILPNNVSGDLNELFLGGHLLKIKGRPVHYLSLPVLEERLGRSIPTGHVEGMEAFWALVRPGPIRPPAREGGLNAAAPSSLDGLIGAAGSLRLPIRQAKAAILYPPRGLHTLITGQTGVGKSSFARNMYDYAVKSGRLAADAAFVTLNCANYADNPQLLLSQLFGHVRGAFTGVCACIEAVEREKAAVMEVMGYPMVFHAGMMRKLLEYEKYPELELFRVVSGPSGMRHRYIEEDAAVGQALLITLARQFGVAVPTMEALVQIASVVNGRDYLGTGKTASYFGWNKLTVRQINEYLETGGAD